MSERGIILIPNGAEITDNTNGNDRKIKTTLENLKDLLSNAQRIVKGLGRITGKVGGKLVELVRRSRNVPPKMSSDNDIFDRNISRLLSEGSSIDPIEFDAITDECLEIITRTLNGYDEIIANQPTEEEKEKRREEKERISFVLENRLSAAIEAIYRQDRETFERELEDVRSGALPAGNKQLARKIVRMKAIISKVMDEYDEQIREAQTEEEKARLREERKQEHDNLTNVLNSAVEKLNSESPQQEQVEVTPEPEVEPILQFGNTAEPAAPLPFADLDEPDFITPTVPVAPEETEEVEEKPMGFDSFDFPDLDDFEQPQSAYDDLDRGIPIVEEEFPIIEETEEPIVTEEPVTTEEPEIEATQDDPVQPEDDKEIEETEEPTVTEEPVIDDPVPSEGDEEIEEPAITEEPVRHKAKRTTSKNGSVTEDLTVFASYEDYYDSHLSQIQNIDELRSIAKAVRDGKTPKGMLNKEEFDTERQRQVDAKKEAELQNAIEQRDIEIAALKSRSEAKETELAAATARAISLDAEVSTLRRRTEEDTVRHIKDEGEKAKLAARAETAEADAKREKESHSKTRAELARVEDEAASYRRECEALQRRNSELEEERDRASREKEIAERTAREAQTREKAMQDRYDQEVHGLLGRLQGIKIEETKEVVEPQVTEAPAPKKAKHAKAAPKHTPKPEVKHSPKHMKTEESEKEPEVKEEPTPAPTMTPAPEIKVDELTPAPTTTPAPEIKVDESTPAPTTTPAPEIKVEEPVVQDQVMQYEETPEETTELYRTTNPDNGGAMLGDVTVTDGGADIKWDFSLGEVAANIEKEALEEARSQGKSI